MSGAIGEQCGWPRAWLRLAPACRRAIRQPGSGGRCRSSSSARRRSGGGRAGPGGADAEGLPEARMVRGGLSQCRPALGPAGPRPRQRPGRLCRGVPVPLRPAPGPLPQRRAADGPAPRYRPRRRQDRPADRLHGLPRRLDRRPELRRAGQHPARPEGPALRADDRRRQAPAVFHVRAQLVARDQQRRPDRRGAPEPAQHGPLGPLVPAAAGGQPPRDGHAPLVAPEAQADDVLRRPHRRPLGPDQHAVPAGREEPRRPQGARADVPRRPGFLQEPRAAEVSVPDRRGQGRARRRSSSRRPASAATAPTDRTASIPTRSSRST